MCVRNVARAWAGLLNGPCVCQKRNEKENTRRELSMSNRKFDKIIVVDLEATCWEPREEQGDQPSEVIEIGLCVLDTKTLDISRKTSYIIRPKYSKISEFCTELTGHTWDSVKTGMPFGDACNKVAKKFGTKNRVWASWGDYDRIHVQEECEAKGAKYPFGISHINLAAMFNIFMGLTSGGVSVENALKKLGMEFDGRQHRADDDAYNTARVFRALIEDARQADWNVGADIAMGRE